MHTSSITTEWLCLTARAGWMRDNAAPTLRERRALTRWLARHPGAEVQSFLLAQMPYGLN